MPTPLIGTGTLDNDVLVGQIAIVTGSGGGIGFEAARALAWLGARVVLAEIRNTGKRAAAAINREMGKETAHFVRTDVGDEGSVRRLARTIARRWGAVDIVLNNATVAPIGAVHSLPIRAWDSSYRVNLRGPVLMARAFLPGMIERDRGVFACVSSEGLGYMGAYETVKGAQSHLARTIDAEVEGTGVIAFTIGPGMVPTATAQDGVRRLAELMGRPLGELQEMVREHTLTVEEAGAGFAAAIALAGRFRGQEIGSRHALEAAGISAVEPEAAPVALTVEQAARALELCRDVLETLREQSDGWRARSVFERQWMLREFKRHAGMPVEQWLHTLKRLEAALQAGDLAGAAALRVSAGRLAGFYARLLEHARGYIRDKEKLEQNAEIIRGWRESAQQLAELVDEHAS